MDRIVGVVNQKDFHNHVMGTTRSIMDYIVPVIFVSTTMKISEAASENAGDEDTYGCGDR